MTACRQIPDRERGHSPFSAQLTIALVCFAACWLQAHPGQDEEQPLTDRSLCPPACSQVPLPACSLFLDKEEDNVIRLRSLEDAAAAATTTDHIERVSHPVAPRG